MAKRTTVVLSQSPSRNPAKRRLEEDVIAGLLFENGIDVTVIPNLYDIKPDSTGMLALSGISGNMIVCSWLYERAAHWILDRNNIAGHVGETLLRSEDDDDEDEDEFEDEADEKDRVIDSRNIPNRKIYCLDLRITDKANEYIDEVKRIHAELNTQVVQLGDLTSRNGSSLPVVNSPSAESVSRMENPTNDTALAADGNGLASPAEANGNGEATVTRIESDGGRRWYPIRSS